MIITDKVIEHYFPQKLIAFKSEYYKLFNFDMQPGTNNPVKGWRYRYIGKEISDERMKIINEYFRNHIVPKLEEDKHKLF